MFVMFACWNKCSQWDAFQVLAWSASLDKHSYSVCWDSHYLWHVMFFPSTQICMGEYCITTKVISAWKVNECCRVIDLRARINQPEHYSREKGSALMWYNIPKNLCFLAWHILDNSPAACYRYHNRSVHSPTLSDDFSKVRGSFSTLLSAILLDSSIRLECTPLVVEFVRFHKRFSGSNDNICQWLMVWRSFLALQIFLLHSQTHRNTSIHGEPGHAMRYSEHSG